MLRTLSLLVATLLCGQGAFAGGYPRKSGNNGFYLGAFAGGGYVARALYGLMARDSEEDADAPGSDDDDQGDSSEEEPREFWVGPEFVCARGDDDHGDDDEEDDGDGDEEKTLTDFEGSDAPDETDGGPEVDLMREATSDESQVRENLARALALLKEGKCEDARALIKKCYASRNLCKDTHANFVAAILEALKGWAAKDFWVRKYATETLGLILASGTLVTKEERAPLLSVLIGENGDGGLLLDPYKSVREVAAKAIGDILASEKLVLTAKERKLLLSILIGENGDGGLLVNPLNKFQGGRRIVAEAIGPILTSGMPSADECARLLEVLVGKDENGGLRDDPSKSVRIGVAKAAAMILTSNVLDSKERERLIHALVGVNGDSGLWDQMPKDKAMEVQMEVAKAITVIFASGTLETEEERALLLKGLEVLRWNQNDTIRLEAVKAIEAILETGKLNEEEREQLLDILGGLSSQGGRLRRAAECWAPGLAEAVLLRALRLTQIRSQISESE